MFQILNLILGILAFTEMTDDDLQYILCFIGTVGQHNYSVALDYVQIVNFGYGIVLILVKMANFQ